jgi:hypothetical protein
MAEYECLEDFLPDLQIEISDIDQRTALMILGMAQVKFCRDTGVLQQVTTHTLDYTEFTYPCIPEYDGFNQRIDNVLAGATEDTLQPLTFLDQWTIADDRNSVTIDDNYLKIQQDGNVLQIVSTVIPYKNADSIDVNVYELYSDTIIKLAKYLIYNQKNKPWSDQAEAQQLLWDYNEMLNSVNFDSIAGGNTSGNQSINLDF